MRNESAEGLLRDPAIAEFIRAHPKAEKRIRRAAEQLAKEPDALQAMWKLLPALGENAVNVFFSYKKKDERVAETIVKLLREHARGKLEIEYMADFTTEITGKQWREKIRASICHANWFILLLPDPSDDWDWCLYETGLFEALGTSADRLICIHHPDINVPDQIEGYHAVPATNDDVKDFLRMVYVMDHPLPGMKPISKLTEAEIQELAKKIVDAIRPPRKAMYRVIFPPWVELKIEHAARLENQDDLDEASVVSCNGEALNIFGFLRRPRTWGMLRSDVTEEDSRWREELLKAIKRIAEGKTFSPIQAVFKNRTGKMYRPVACAIDRLGNNEGPIELFHITFVEEVGALDLSSIPKSLSILATILRLSIRFRWEVLESFSKGGMEEEDVARLESTYLRMRADSRSRGVVIDQAAVESIFPPAKARRVSELFTAWHTLKNDQGTGELDIAIREKDVQRIPGILTRAIPVSQEFLEMAADRFSELIAGKG